ncbi:cupin domain-containing protein [Saccharothrix variisporea]|uniref:Mannose-6-phosphate isomerase-like protein (Cupin superfamily) n=1 Tax=Saccharothrix variisporea TaxID=543527 RepID=A0A495X3G3_9PSEU|nr:cupin domain-containing protein [Saccharothrix variisporea]RKT67765.1 mannose-6-phosphate isomerase-like protein (cupin superfamily) [Saccharothrix variisporea]
MSYPPARYLADQGEFSAVFRPATTPPDLTIGVKSRVGHLATGATTEGQFGLYRWDMAAIPNGPGAHFHKTFSESFFVLEGTVSLFDGDRWIDATPGDFLYVPPGGVHAFSNNSAAPASMLVLFTPGAPREAYFEELADIVASGRQLTPEEWTRLYAEHDQYEA